METIGIFIGTEYEGEKRIERYQLQVNPQNIACTYDDSYNREKFYEKVSDVFAQRILKEPSYLKIIFINGKKVNPETKKPEKIQKLEQELEENFKTKIKKNKKNKTYNTRFF